MPTSIVIRTLFENEEGQSMEEACLGFPMTWKDQVLLDVALYTRILDFIVTYILVQENAFLCRYVIQTLFVFVEHISTYKYNK